MAYYGHLTVSACYPMHVNFDGGRIITRILSFNKIIQKATLFKRSYHFLFSVKKKYKLIY